MSTACCSLRVEVPIDARFATVAEWLKRFISRQAVERLDKAHSTATVGLFRHAMDVLAELGYDDAIAAVCDKTRIYVDLQRRSGDLSSMTEAVLASEAIYGPFAELRIVLARHSEERLYLAVARVEPGAPGDPPQLRLDFAARDLNTRVREGESAEQFLRRIRAWAEDGASAGALVAQTRADARAFAERFDSRTPEGPACTVGGTELRLVALDVVDAGRLRHLGFDEFVRNTSYRADPSYSRSAPNDGPFDYYVFDPYDVLVRAVLIGAVAEGALRISDLHLVSSTGTSLGRGDAIADATWTSLAVQPDQVRLEDGDLVVDESIPIVSALDVAEALSEHAPGYGGGE